MPYSVSIWHSLHSGWCGLTSMWKTSPILTSTAALNSTLCYFGSYVSAHSLNQSESRVYLALEPWIGHTLSLKGLGETGWVWFFCPVASVTIVLPSSFLACIPPHNALKSKLPFDKADWSCARTRRGGGEDSEAERCKNTRAQRASRHSQGCVRYMISPRPMLSCPPRQTEGHLKSKEITTAQRD